jgi:hypothetical protein
VLVTRIALRITEIEIMRRLRGILSSCAVFFIATYAQSASAAPPGADEPPSAPQQGSGNHVSELVYLSPEVGAEYVGLETLHLTRELFPSRVHNADVGPVVGIGAGVRFLFVTLGPRFRFGHFRDWDLWTLDGELGFKAPLGAIEPFFSIGGGYAKVGSLQDSRVKVQGYDIRLTAGLDYYFNKNFSVGGLMSAEVLGMTRPGVDLNQSTGSVSQDVAKLDGSSVGLAILASAGVGVHL